MGAQDEQSELIAQDERGAQNAQDIYQGRKLWGRNIREKFMQEQDAILEEYCRDIILGHYNNYIDDNGWNNEWYNN